MISTEPLAQRTCSMWCVNRFCVTECHNFYGKMGADVCVCCWFGLAKLWFRLSLHIISVYFCLSPFRHNHIRIPCVALRIVFNCARIWTRIRNVYKYVNDFRISSPIRASESLWVASLDAKPSKEKYINFIFYCLHTAYHNLTIVTYSYAEHIIILCKCNRKIRQFSGPKVEFATILENVMWLLALMHYYKDTNECFRKLATAFWLEEVSEKLAWQWARNDREQRQRMPIKALVTVSIIVHSIFSM